MASRGIFLYLRRRVILEQHNLCFYCGCEMLAPHLNVYNSATLDHIKPRKGVVRPNSGLKGGFVAACKSCNSKRGTTPFTAYLFRLDSLQVCGRV